MSDTPEGPKLLVAHAGVAHETSWLAHTMMKLAEQVGSGQFGPVTGGLFIVFDPARNHAEIGRLGKITLGDMQQIGRQMIQHAEELSRQQTSVLFPGAKRG